MIEYKIVSMVEVDDSGLSYKIHKDPWGDWKEQNAVVKLEYGGITDIIGTDGGEPEDNTLRRDWSWIATALNDAYAAGIEYGSGLYCEND